MIVLLNVTLIAPNIVMQKGDFFGTGIPYMPITLAYLAAYLRSKKVNVNVIDSFGENPFCVTDKGKHYVQGLRPEKIINRIKDDSDYVIISCERLVAHNSVLDIVSWVKKRKSYL